MPLSNGRNIIAYMYILKLESLYKSSATPPTCRAYGTPLQFMPVSLS